MTLTLSYEDKRDLLTGMLYKRSNTQVASRSYTYDTLGRPTSRGTARDGQSVNYRGGGLCLLKQGKEKMDCIVQNTINNIFSADGAEKQGKCKNYNRSQLENYIRKYYDDFLKNMPF